MGLTCQRDIQDQKTRKHQMTKQHSKYYYDFNRNTDPTTNCCNQKFIDETIFCSDCKEPATPEYYIGSEGLEAIDVIHQFNLSYDLGSACSYILRAKNKHDDEGYECIKKAIHHLQYELKRICKKKTSNQS